MAKWSPNYNVYEVFGSRVENWQLGSPTVRVTLECDMAERYYVLADIVGEHRAYPFSDTPACLYATSGTIRLDRARKDSSPTDARETYSSGYKAFLDINYTDWENLWWRNQDSQSSFAKILEYGETFEPSMQFLTDDFHKYGWSSNEVTGPMDRTDPRAFDNEDILKQGEEVGIPFYQVVLDRVVMGYTALPIGYADTTTTGTFDVPTSFEKWPGYVHAKDYRSPFTDLFYPAGTLLFTQPNVDFGVYLIQFQKDGDGNPTLGYCKTYKVTAKLIYQPMGWNAFFRNTCANNEDQKGWYPMVYLGCDDQSGFRTGYNPYSYLDMSQFIFSGSNPPTVLP